MSKVKTVVLFVRQTNESEDRDTTFTESTEVGKGKHWKTPSAFINEFAKLYRSCQGNSRFKIENVVIG